MLPFGEDAAVLVRVDVVADAQEHVADLGKDHPVRDRPQRVEVVARDGVVVLGEARAAVLDQVEILVGVGRRLAHREADVAERRVREHEPQIGVGLGQVDVVARLERHVVGRRGEAGHVVVGVRRAARGVDLEVVRDLADRAAVGVDVDRLAEDVGGGVVQRVDDRAGAAAERDVAGREVSVAGGLDHADVHVAGDLVEVDAERAAVVRREVVRVDVAERAARDRVGVDLEEVPRHADPAGAGHPADAVVAGGEDDVASGRDVDAVRAARRVAVVTPLEVVRILAIRVVVVVLRRADAVEQLSVDDPARGVEDDVGRESRRGIACRSSRCPSSGCVRRAGRRRARSRG